VIGKARIVRAGTARIQPLVSAAHEEPTWRRVTRAELEAKARAEAIVTAARAEAASIRSRALQEGRESVERAALEAAQAAQTELSARWLALRQAELKTLQSTSERVVVLATALAERLLGAALAVDSTRVVELARGVFAEARGARRARVDANPLDVHVLRERLSTADFDLQSIEIREDPSLARGELRLQTDVGNIDARLAPRFDRLAAALRDALL
jgi:flagellar assembly protein FliH